MLGAVAPPLPEPRVRGALILEQIKIIEERYGRNCIDAALEALTPAQSEEVRGILAVSWVDVPLVTTFKSEIARHLGRDPLDLQREVVRESINQTVKGLWRMLLRQLSDPAIIKRTPILYSKTFDRGKLALEGLGDGKATFVLTGWPTMPEYDCVGLATGIESVLEYAGRTGATVTWQRQAPLVLFNAVWTRR